MARCQLLQKRLAVQTVASAKREHHPATRFAGIGDRNPIGALFVVESKAVLLVDEIGRSNTLTNLLSCETNNWALSRATKEDAKSPQKGPPWATGAPVYEAQRHIPCC
jgi:hypothetical protein